MNPGKRALLFYLLLLFGQIAHVFEEFWGEFWIIRSILGPGWFLAVNLILLAIPFILLYFWILERPWARRLSRVYAALMVLNGLGHGLATLATGRYFGGFAGAVSGVWLIAAGIPLFLSLKPGESSPR